MARGSHREISRGASKSSPGQPELIPETIELLLGATIILIFEAFQCGIIKQNFLKRTFSVPIERALSHNSHNRRSRMVSRIFIRAHMTDRTIHQVGVCDSPVLGQTAPFWLGAADAPRQFGLTYGLLIFEVN